MLEYFNCYTSKKELYSYEKLKQELNGHGLNIKEDENSIKEDKNINLLEGNVRKLKYFKKEKQ
ncbi:hypothetical protein F358_053 [Campylobacter phage F358]|uniref:Uncharacterized protein n=4 Tax=Fletchervirus CPX TaxID=1110702 RepID=A0A7T3N4R6_9CAUD|nr:hypothetical protein F357_054 [Campylobacter phage F357]QPX64024.1 hypothetical protein F358_053 [Campylobacter phage F358]QPX64187.1 hypothetical protein F360_054 [Campylobacter phage F360]QPX64843.1 hypothetical protein F368_052 [Campylobacter phage F368]